MADVTTPTHLAHKDDHYDSPCRRCGAASWVVNQQLWTTDRTKVTCEVKA